LAHLLADMNPVLNIGDNIGVYDLTPAEHVERVYIQNTLKKYNIDLEYKSIVRKKDSIQHYIS